MSNTEERGIRIRNAEEIIFPADPQQELTMGSLFDGIGGFPLAAIRNGIKPLWASEIEAFPIEVTKLRFPDMVHVGDITKLNGAELPPVTLVCGGSPCTSAKGRNIILQYYFRRWVTQWIMATVFLKGVI